MFDNKVAGRIAQPLGIVNEKYHYAHIISCNCHIFVIAMLPVELLGCRNRGLIAAVVAVVAGIAGIFSAVKALMGKIRGDAKSFLWMASALIFAVPAIYIVIVAA